jgi:hypothetical protein
MKNKSNIIILLTIILVLSFLTSCTNFKLTPPTKATVAEIGTTTIQETTTIQTTTTTQETTTTEKPANVINLLSYDNLVMTVNTCMESNIAVGGGFTDGTFTCTAKPGMKFEIIFFEFKNNGKSVVKTPYIGSSLDKENKIIVNYGDKYDLWSNGWAHLDEEYNRREATSDEINKLIGNNGGFESLYPEESINGSLAFEIPSNQTSKEIQLKIEDNIYNIPITENMIVQNDIYDTVTTLSKEDANNDVKISIKDFIEKGYDGKVTKIVIADDMSVITVSYNTKWFVKDTVRKELFDITTGFTTGDTIVFALDLSATTEMGNIYKSFTSKENLQKIKDLEMSYEDWLKVAIK